jgi:hypothetical protein
MIPVSERAKTFHGLDCATTVIGFHNTTRRYIPEDIILQPLIICNEGTTVKLVCGNSVKLVILKVFHGIHNLNHEQKKNERTNYYCITNKCINSLTQNPSFEAECYPTYQKITCLLRNMKVQDHFKRSQNCTRS